jgi:hypothetical protein
LLGLGRIFGTCHVRGGEGNGHRVPLDERDELADAKDEITSVVRDDREAVPEPFEPGVSYVPLKATIVGFEVAGASTAGPQIRLQRLDYPGSRSESLDVGTTA